MKATQSKSVRILTTIVFSAVLLSGLSVSALAQEGQAQQTQQNWAQHRQNWVKARLARVAERLEIKSSQQSVWQAYAKAIEEATNVPFKRPDANADAATLARTHADFVAAQAKGLAQIADATAKLQEALTPDQRKTLDQIAHAFRQHGQHRHDGNDKGQWHPENR